MWLNLCITQVAFKSGCGEVLYAMKTYELCMFGMYCCSQWLYLLQAYDHEWFLGFSTSYGWGQVMKYMTIHYKKNQRLAMDKFCG